MPTRLIKPLALTASQARRLWMRAQRLDEPAPFGAGPAATPAAVRHLGYVQIDTIAVIERCHHHILWSRIPSYHRTHLHAAQSETRDVFEYWTHALSYVPAADYRFFVPAMKAARADPRHWFGHVTPEEMRRVVKRIRDEGPLTIRDVDDDVLVEKDHAWASRKPTKRVLQAAFFAGLLTISARAGMLKTYALPERHFGWPAAPKPASPRQVDAYVLDRALRAQAIVSLDSVCHLDAPRKPAVRALIEARVRRGDLRAASVDGDRTAYWVDIAALDTLPPPGKALVHILSPFDPLIIQRKRLAALFGYHHRFEAYLPREKRVFGYFTCPVLVGDEVVAVLDMKADRAAGALLIQRWTPVGLEPDHHRARIEEALHRFETFQLATP